MILLQDDAWGAGFEGSPRGDNYDMDREWAANSGSGHGCLGMHSGNGAGFDENVKSDLVFITDPLQFEQLVTNAALQITWSTTCKRNKSL